MKIYVAGGLGFIGHVVTNMLMSAGHECAIIDTFEDYGILNNAELIQVYAERQTILGSPRVTAISTAKITDIKNADVIINLASFPRAKAVDLNPVRASDAMHVGTVNLCQQAKRNNAKMIFISSSMVYGDWQDELAIETHTPNPQGLYALMKYQGEQLVNAMCDDYIIIRPSAVYGPRDVTDRVVSLMFKAAMNNEPIRVEGPNNVLDFTYVDDLAQGIVAAATSDVKNITVNMSRGRGRTLLELATLIKNITNTSSKIELLDHNTRYPKRGPQDITVAKHLFNFHPTVDLEVGLDHYYNWLKSR